MATLQELLDIEGVGAAGEFSLDGSLLNYEAKIDMSEELAQKTAQYCVAISLMFNTLASSFTDLSGMNWVP
jgi:roadblock/LC7 domain-containing protein